MYENTVRLWILKLGVWVGTRFHQNFKKGITKKIVKKLQSVNFILILYKGNLIQV